MWLDGAIHQPNCTDIVCSHALHQSRQALLQQDLCSGCPCAGAVTFGHADSLLARPPKWMLRKLQVVQNNTARLMICHVSKHSHIYFTNAEISSLTPCQTKDQAQIAMLGLQGPELCRCPVVPGPPVAADEQDAAVIWP